MKICSVCGCCNADEASSCVMCGVNFLKAEASETASVSAAPPVADPIPVPPKSTEDNKADRMALAGFIMSLMGVVTCMTSPLQLAALILSIAAGKAKKFRTFRLIGIVLSAVALGVSLILWLIVAANADGVLAYITDIMNEFYY